MATTTADLQLRLAYRLGENSVPNNSNEKARRLSFLNEAGRDIVRRHYWWFTESEATFDSVANQEYYSTDDSGFPSDLRTALEVRYQDNLYSPLQQGEILDGLTVPYSGAYNSYMVFSGRLYFVPVLPTTVTDGVTMKYYRNYTPLVADSDETIIPDLFSDAQVAYALGRIKQLTTDRGSASDAFDEYNEILDLMSVEQNKYLFSLKYSTESDDIPTYP